MLVQAELTQTKNRGQRLGLDKSQNIFHFITLLQLNIEFISFYTWFLSNNL